MIYSTDEHYEGNKENIYFYFLIKFLICLDSSTSKIITEDNNNHFPRSVKDIRSIRSSIIPSISLSTMQDDHDYDLRRYLSNQVD